MVVFPPDSARIAPTVWAFSICVQPKQAKKRAAADTFPGYDPSGIGPLAPVGTLSFLFGPLVVFAVYLSATI